VTEGVQWQSPDEGAVVGKNMKAQSVAFDGRHREHANVEELGLVRLTVVEEFSAEKTVEPGDIDVQRCQLLPFLSSMVLRKE